MGQKYHKPQTSPPPPARMWVARSGITLKRIAQEARLSREQVGNLLRGRRQSPEGRKRVYRAFRRLSGWKTITEGQFWTLP